MKHASIILITLFSCLSCFCQSITGRLILTDNKDSFLINAETKSFDNEGNYCFVTKEGGRSYFSTNDGKSGGVRFIGSTYGNGGDISYTFDLLYDSINKPWFYKNTRGTKVLGPATGKLEKYMTSGTKANIAITTSLEDTIWYYVNGKMVSKNLRWKLKNFDIDHYDWCAFSENGNSIYYIKKDSLYELYVNGKLIDKSVNNFNELHINNNGDYTYAEGRRPDGRTTGYDYMFFVHTKDTIIGPVRTVWKNDLTESNSYFYTGDDNGTDYIIINNSLQKGIKDVSNITLLNSKNYFYTYKQDGGIKINVNGKVYSHSISEALLPVVNNEGAFACYGIKDYYLYKFINGRQVESPITKYGVRPMPLYISPNGTSLQYFKTDDFIYLYEDDKLLFNPIDKNLNFVIKPYTELFSDTYENDEYQNGNSLFYLEYDKACYWVFNGTFSKPILPAKHHSYHGNEDYGEIVTPTFNKYGFFAIQKTGNSKYQVNVNNKIYTELNNVDVIFDDTYFLNDKELIFYGSKGLSIYQFNLSL